MKAIKLGPKTTLNEQIALAADKATAYTMTFRKLREKCKHYGICVNWGTPGCVHKDRLGPTGGAGMCHPQLCPLKSGG